MRISMDDEEKMLLFWLTREEGQRADCDKIVDEIAAIYCPDPKYRVVTFLSGEGDYVEATKALLRHNL